MQRDHGIDLSLKAIMWEDEKGTVWLTSDDPIYLVGHRAAAECDEVVKEVDVVLGTLVQDAVNPDARRGTTADHRG